MHQQSGKTKNNAKIEFEHIDLDKDFPITVPHYGIRGYKCSWVPHIHDCLEIGYCKNGEGFFQVGSKFMPFKGGDAIIINNHEFHWARAKKNKTAHWGFMSLNPNLLLRDAMSPFSPILKMSIYTGDKFHNVIDGETQHELAEAIGDIFREQDDHGRDYKDMIRALVIRMLVMLYRTHGQYLPDNPVCDNGAEIKLVPALNYINKHITSPMKVTDLANMCYTSEANFRKLFVKTIGCAPQIYIIKMRLNLACAMLVETEKSVSEIAFECGFKDISNFNRQFVKYINCSPRSFRKNSIPGNYVNIAKDE